jgi:hypothetical protein
MIARLLPTAHLPVHVRRDQTVTNRWAEKQMIDTKACVPGPCVSIVIPEGIDALTGVKHPQSTNVTTISRAAFQKKLIDRVVNDTNRTIRA